MASDAIQVQDAGKIDHEETAESDRLACPECDAPTRPDGDEVVCAECGLVVQEDRLHRGPNWCNQRENDPTRGSQRQNGTASSEALHDRGLSTEIWGDVDANGNPLPGEKRRQLSRLRTWHVRSRFDSKRDRNLARGFGEITRMASALGLSLDRRDQAARLFRSAQSEDLFFGRSIEAMASAAVYAVGRIHQLALLLSDVEAVSRVGRDRIENAYGVLNRGLEIPAPPPHPTTYVGRIASDLECPADVRRMAEELAERHRDEYPSKAAHPAGVAGGAIYIASQRVGFQRTQGDIAERADVTTRSLRLRVYELEEVADA